MSSYIQQISDKHQTEEDFNRWTWIVILNSLITIWGILFNLDGYMNQTMVSLLINFDFKQDVDNPSRSNDTSSYCNDRSPSLEFCLGRPIWHFK